MKIEEFVPLVVEFRRCLHQHPESSMEEYGTQQYIAGIFDKYGISYKKQATGLIATIGRGNRCVALRADMDALEIKEETGLPYASVNEGMMHACGHDMHMAILLGAALVLKSQEEGLSGTIKLIFQPSEEKRPGGARLLLPFVMEAPTPQAIFGQHIFPGLPVGTVGIRSGAFFASSDNIHFTIEGKGTHAAMPHLGANPIQAAVALIQYYQTIATKFHNPLLPVILSITSIHGGTSNNVIPDRVEVKGTVRTHNDEVRHRIFELINEKSPAICGLYGCRFIPDMPGDGLPPLVNEPILTERIKTLAATLPLVEKVVELPPLMLGEDFAIYTERLPGTFWVLGVCPAEQSEMPPLHSPEMAPDERAIPVGMAMLVSSCLDFLKNT